MKHTDILRKYTNGEATLAETNAALKECRAGFHLDPQRNYINPAEKDLFGLLDTGTGSLDKVRVVDGKLYNCHCGEMVAFCHYNGKIYRVHGDALGDVVEI